MRFRFTALPLLASFLFAAPALAPKVVYIPFEAAKPVVEAFKGSLPADLKSKPETAVAAEWPQWVRKQDQGVRARLEQGDEDSLVNLLLYGTSFTKQPRVTDELMDDAENEGKVMGQDSPKMKALPVIFQSRVRDLVTALSAPGNNERLQYMRHMLENKGYDLSTPAGKNAVAQLLITDLKRMHEEFVSYHKQLEAARQLDTEAQFHARSQLFRNRGLALDTSLSPDYALEQALKGLLEKKLFSPGSVRRVAIIGPGLDFVDKREGYDFYPQQTIQPFAVMDSLLRLGLSTKANLRVTTLDISSRVLNHVRQARARAQRSVPYTIQLPLNKRIPWKEGTLAYWRSFGDHIGKSVPPVRVPPEVGGAVEVRAVQLPPSMVLRITPVDLNAVWQREVLPAGQHYDLIIATNVLVYYDQFEQALAESNIQEMLRPGGVFLCNNALPDVASLAIHPAGETTTIYSDRPDDGDQIVWYVRK